MPEREAFRATVEGTVQGVGFRFATREYARSLGLAGYVRNRPDGTVEVVCEGSRGSLDQMERWLHKGPTHAHVSRVTVNRVASTGVVRFVIR